MRPNDAPDNNQAGKKRPPSKQIPGPSVCVPAVPFSLFPADTQLQMRRKEKRTMHKHYVLKDRRSKERGE